MAEYGPDTENAYEIAPPIEGDDPAPADTHLDLLRFCAEFIDDGALGWTRTGRQPNEWESAGGARLRLTWATGEVTATFLAAGWDRMATFQRALHTERFRLRSPDDYRRFGTLVARYTNGRNPEWEAQFQASAPAPQPQTPPPPPSAVAVALPVAPFETAVQVAGGLTALDSGLLPTRAYSSDAGLDLYTVGEWNVAAGSWIDVPCGIRIALPDHVWGMLTGRSSTLRKKNLLVPMSVIDPGYRGPLFVQAWNLGTESVTIRDKERIGQLILVPNVTPTFDPTWVEAVDSTERGGSGFGSSGS